jgi:hypothetical protein
MTLNSVNDVQHWRARAAEMRALAATMKDIDTQAIKYRLADDYDKLAERAALRSNGPNATSVRPDSGLKGPVPTIPQRTRVAAVAATMKKPRMDICPTVRQGTQAPQRRPD